MVAGRGGLRRRAADGPGWQDTPGTSREPPPPSSIAWSTTRARSTSVCSDDCSVSLMPHPALRPQPTPGRGGGRIRSALAAPDGRTERRPNPRTSPAPPPRRPRRCRCLNQRRSPGGTACTARPRSRGRPARSGSCTHRTHRAAGLPAPAPPSPGRRRGPWARVRTPGGHRPGPPTAAFPVQAPVGRGRRPAASSCASGCAAAPISAAKPAAPDAGHWVESLRRYRACVTKRCRRSLTSFHNPATTSKTTTHSAMMNGMEGPARFTAVSLVLSRARR